MSVAKVAECGIDSDEVNLCFAIIPGFGAAQALTHFLLSPIMPVYFKRKGRKKPKPNQVKPKT